MRTSFRKISRSVSRSTSSWLTLVLLFVVLVPSIGLIWFMNQAMLNERLAVRQKLIDVYRAQLIGIQPRVLAGWQTRVQAVDELSSDLSASEVFAQVVRSGAADAAVILGSDKIVTYPTAPDTLRVPRPDAAWTAASALETTDKRAAAQAYARIAEEAADAQLAARALQTQARCLFQAGAIDEALALVNGPLQGARFATALDSQNRSVLANAELHALEFLPPRSSLAFAIVERLRLRVLNYQDFSLPSGQRRFVMRELQRHSPDPTLASLLAGEDLAAAYLENRDASDPFATGSTFRLSDLPGVWENTASREKMILLHRTETLPTRLKQLIAPADLPTGARIDFLAPGEERENALILMPMGAILPGWRLALSLDDTHLAGVGADQRTSSYVWIGVLMVFTVVLLALLTWGLVRRQVALTELRNDLVANVTHELKTPLASMRLLVETLLNAPKWNEQTAREYLQLIATENLRLSRLIGNFLTFSRIERNKYSFHFEDVSPHAIVDAAVAALGDRFNQPGCRFEVVAPPGLPRVTADADAIVTALVNLLDNAWKYSGEAKHIVLTAGARNNQVYWSIRDNGIGLSPRDTKRIFHRFQQVQSHLSSSGGGCGLGLSIVQFIVEAHHGTVEVESAPDQGSTFIITLPSSGAKPGSNSTP